MGTGRRGIELDARAAAEVLRANTVTRAAVLLGVHRNTLYRRMQQDPAWREIVSQARRPCRIAYTPNPFDAWLHQNGLKPCSGCWASKSLTDFPYRKATGTYRAMCKECTKARWRELYAERRGRRSGARFRLARLWFAALRRAEIEIIYRLIPYVDKPQAVEVPEDINAMVNAAIPQYLSRQQREEICQNVILALLTDEIAPENLQGEIKKYVRQVLWPNKRTHFSLDRVF